MILLTGVTGKIGTEVANLIKDSDIPVRALVRDIEKASFLNGTNIDVVAGSFDDLDSLKSAHNGVSKLFLLPANSENQLDQEINIIDIAAQEGVEHVVKLSVVRADANSDNNILQWHGLAEKHLEESGIAYTHLQPNFFMQNLIFHASQTIKEKDAFYLPMKDGKCGLVDVRDIASAVVEVLIQDGHENKTYQITGPESLDFSTIAEKLSSILGREITYFDAPPETFKHELLSYGVPETLSEAVKHLYVKLSDGHLDIVSNHVYEITGRNPLSVDDFLKDHFHMFA